VALISVSWFGFSAFRVVFLFQRRRRVLGIVVGFQLCCGSLVLVVGAQSFIEAVHLVRGLAFFNICLLSIK